MITMTTETLNSAITLAKRMADIEESLSSLECRLHIRKRDFEDCNRKQKGLILMPKWFAKGTIKENNRVNLNIPVECVPPLEFEIDEECVEFIIKHEREKLRKLKKEFEEL